MFFVDDILFSPLKGIMWIFKELSNAAQQEVAGEAESITNELSELYMRLDIGEISEDQFDAREKELLDRLDQIQDRYVDGDDEDDES